MSAYSRKKRAGKIPKVRTTPKPVHRHAPKPPADLAPVRHQRPLISYEQAARIEQAEKDRRFYEGLMRQAG